MTFQFMPELVQKWGYPIVLFVMAIVTGLPMDPKEEMALINIY
ncbi:MAG: hypothetical protein WKF85_15450 [Chitinophagaceae bacterium]